MAEQRHSPLKDDRLNDPNEHIEVVFDGSITLWRSATNLDVVLVYFEKLRCMELLVFHPVRVLEAPRIYIDFATLEKHLPREEMQKQVEGRKELFLRRHCTYVASEIEKEVEMTTISNYVVSRIAVADGDDFIIELQAHFGDTMESDVSADGMSKQHLDFVIGKPEGLIPINTEHYAKPSILEFQRKMSIVTADQESIKESFSKAHRMLRIFELAAATLSGGQLRTTNPNLTVATLRWKRAINRVINLNMCEKFRNILRKKDGEALLKKPIEATPVVPDFTDLEIKGLGPLNEAGILPMYHRSKFENHLSQSKEHRHEQSRHAPIHILQKSSSRRPSLADIPPMIDEHSVSQVLETGPSHGMSSGHSTARRPSLVQHTPSGSFSAHLPSAQDTSFHLDPLPSQHAPSRKSSVTSVAHLPVLGSGVSGKAPHSEENHLFHPPKGDDQVHSTDGERVSPKRDVSQRNAHLRSFDHGKTHEMFTSHSSPVDLRKDSSHTLH